MADLTNSSDYINKSDINTSLSLNYVEYQLFLKDLPAFIYLVILFIVGTIGNVHTLVIYYKQFSASNHRTIVLALSLIDLIGCAVAVPYDILDMRHYLTIPTDFNCRFFIFLDFFTGIGSVILLAFIALERFRKICKPHSRQLTISETKVGCLLVIIFSGAASVPCFLLYTQAMEETEYPGIYRTMCVDAKNSVKMFYFRIYNTLLLCLSAFLLIVCVVSYLFLSSKLRNHRRKLSNVRASFSQEAVKRTNSDPKTSDTQDSNNQTGDTKSTDQNGDYIDLDAHIEPEQTTIHCSEYEVKETSDDTKIPAEVRLLAKQSSKREKHLQRSERITLVFLVTTIVSYGCFLTTVITEFLWSWGHNFAINLGAVFAFILRFQFINNAVNPIVYFALDNRFRMKVKQLYIDLFKKFLRREPIRKQSLVSVGSNFKFI